MSLLIGIQVTSKKEVSMPANRATHDDIEQDIVMILIDAEFLIDPTELL